MIKRIISIISRIIKNRFNLLAFKFEYFISRQKLKGKKVFYGKRTYGNNFSITNNGIIVLGNNVFLNSFPNGSSFKTTINTYFHESKVLIGNNCRLNGIVIHSNNLVQIGDDCMFGPGTIIVDNDSHRLCLDPFERRGVPESRPVIIENNVWVGMNCIILKGVHIGKNAVIAAGSVVTKDVQENSLYGGNPARFIKEIY